MIFIPAVHAQLDPQVDIPGSGLSAETDLKVPIVKVINFILGFTGLLALVALIYGGISYIISFGDENGAEKAKRVILYAIIGLIVIALSAVIVNQVLKLVPGGAQQDNKQDNKKDGPVVL